MTARFRIIFTTLILFSAYGAFAQTTVEPDLITIEDGLSQGYISCLLQDREGFLWIGTKNGLNRYDGEQFEIFTQHPGDPYSISGDWVNAIAEKDDYLLIGTSNGGLNIFSKKQQRFYKIPTTDATLDFWPTMDIGSILFDETGQLWCSEEHSGMVARLRVPKGFWENLAENEGLLKDVEIRAFRDFFLSGISSGGDGFIYGETKQRSFIKININTFNWEKFYDRLSNDQDGYYRFSRSEHGLIAYPDLGNHYLLFQKGIPRDIQLEDSLMIWQYDVHQATLWVRDGTDVLIYENFNPDRKMLNRNEAIRVIKDIGNEYRDVLVDRSGVIWLTTGGEGLVKIAPRQLDIQTFFSGESIYAPIYRTPQGEIILHNPITTVWSTASKASFPEFLGGAWWLSGDHDDVWVVGIKDNKEILAYHLDDEMDVQKRVVLANDLDGISQLHAAVLYNQTDIWVASPTANLIHYNDISGEIATYDFKGLFTNVFDCYSLARSPNGHWWIGTSRGLIHGIPNRNQYQFELITSQTGKTGGLLNDEVSCILNDPKDPNTLWLATKGGGLHQLDSRTMEFTYVTQKDGLPNDVIYGILPDETGRLWMSSNKGIISYDPGTHVIYSFTRDDGLQGNEFNTWAYAKTPDGDMMFGGINGLNVFDPDELQENPVKPQVWITGLTVNNVPVAVGDSTKILSQSPEFTRDITLPYTKNSITLQFAALEFSAPEKNRYRYYLDGAEDEWRHESTDNFATYLNLSPDRYTFRLTGSNNDGVWNETPVALHITILPPWYRTNFAYLIYFVLIGTGAWWLLRYQQKRLKWQHEREMDKKEADRLKELDQVKSRIYTNITHEFRTPLTVIKGNTDQITGNEEKKQVISRNLDRLLNLVNQLLELSKLESGSFVVRMHQLNIIDLIREIFDSFVPVASEKDIGMHFFANPDELRMDCDIEITYRIVGNLLSNAVKFTQSGGNIYLNIAQDGEFLLITVRDTGIGIPEDKINKIFNRFYQADDTLTRAGEGTGIGLALTKEIIDFLHGKISVHSTYGKGTMFDVRLPVTQNAAPVSDDTFGMSTTIASSMEQSRASVDTSQEPTMGLPSALIVEDNPDVIHYLMSCLRDQYQLHVAMDGQEGVEKAFAEIPDVIISDVMMPVKDGVQLCREVREDERTSHIPVILLTAKADVASRIEGLTRGADVYMAKPFEKDELVVVARNLIEMRRTLRERYLKEDPDALHDDPDMHLEDSFMKRLNALIDEHIDDEDYGVIPLSHAMHYSRSQVHKKLKALTGLSTTAYIQHRRLLRAKALLDNGNLNISEVAYAVGFRDPNYFSRVFRKEFGLSPTEFTESGRPF